MRARSVTYTTGRQGGGRRAPRAGSLGGTLPELGLPTTAAAPANSRAAPDRAPRLGKQSNERDYERRARERDHQPFEVEQARTDPGKRHLQRQYAAAIHGRRRVGRHERQGKVTETPIDATIHGLRATMSWLTSAPRPRRRTHRGSFDDRLSGNSERARRATYETRANHEADATCRTVSATVNFTRERAAQVTSPSDPAVTVTSEDAARYAYTKLVRHPSPPALRREGREVSWSAMGRLRRHRRLAAEPEAAAVRPDGSRGHSRT